MHVCMFYLHEVRCGDLVLKLVPPSLILYVDQVKSSLPGLVAEPSFVQPRDRVGAHVTIGPRDIQMATITIHLKGKIIETS